MITIVRAPAYATVQDGGRHACLNAGVPTGGAMDRCSLDHANALLGNTRDCAGIEWALTGGAVRFDRECWFVLTGAEAAASLDGSPVRRGRAMLARRGAVLEIARLMRGRFVYLAVAGGIDVPVVLGGRGTYLAAGFGGFEGRRLRTGDVLPLGEPTESHPIETELPSELDPLSDASPLALLSTDEAAVADAVNVFDVDLAVAPESDRTGYRLSGARMQRPVAGDRRSEPSCVGALQVTPRGELIALMADGPTIGGYPRIGVIASIDAPRLGQSTAGDTLRFVAATMADATTRLRTQERLLLDIARLTGADWR